MSGWYPAYWDYCKARWPLDPQANAEFGKLYLPKAFGYDFESMYDYWAFFMGRVFDRHKQ